MVIKIDPDKTLKDTIKELLTKIDTKHSLSELLAKIDTKHSLLDDHLLLSDTISELYRIAKSKIEATKETIKTILKNDNGEARNISKLQGEARNISKLQLYLAIAILNEYINKRRKY